MVFGFIIGMLLGAAIGYTVAALMFAAKKGDEECQE